MPKKEFTHRDAIILQKMLEEGFLQKDIAEQLGFCPDYISDRIKEFGFKTETKKIFNPEIGDELDEIDFYTCVHQPTKDLYKLQLERIFIKGKKIGFDEALKVYKDLLQKEREAFAEKLYRMYNQNKEKCESALMRKVERIESEKTFKN